MMRPATIITQLLLKRRIVTSGVYLCTAVAVAAASVTGAYAAKDTPVNLAPPAPLVVPMYLIEPGDVLDISVMDELQLSKVVTVVPDGTISYPYLGEIKVSGLTTGDLRRRITAALKEQLVNPEVTVAISRRREKSVSVLGMVKSPGKRALQDGWRVLDVLADCGGLTVRPEWTSAVIARGDGSGQVRLDLVRLLSQTDTRDNPLIASGDVLLVQEKEVSQTQVQVVGEVLRPGQVPVPADGSVITVLNTVGGTTPGAALAGVTILRAGQTLPVNLSDYSDTGVIPGNVRLVAGDTLVVPRNRKQFAVLGAVQRPGLALYPEDGRLDVIAALALAGGSSTEADLKNGVIIRKRIDAPAAVDKSDIREPVTVRVDLSVALKKGLPSLSLPLEPGDILYIPSRRAGGNSSGLVQLMSVVPLLGFLIR